MLHADFDWRNPDYSRAIRERMRFIEDLRRDPSDLAVLKAYYKSGPEGMADFISDWGWTYDPRNTEVGLPTLIPFILFQRQREWVVWVWKHWREQTPGLTEKSRDMGLSWLMMAVSCTFCLFFDGMAIGVGSRKTEYVDKLGTYKPLLPKARIFMENLPPEFKGDWQPWRDAPFMRINFPATGSFIGGEGGDELGRGDRTSLFFIDEFAFFERPEVTERSLAQTTNCRIDVSTPRGMNNSFAQKRWGGKVDVFIHDWRSDPRKDEEWYRLLSAPADQGGKGLDSVTIAQEVDRDYWASVHGIVIPSAWVRSAIGACERLGITPSGHRGMSLDVADEGIDKNAVCRSHGVEVVGSEDWSGKGADIYATVERAFALCDEHGYDEFDYDADGLGAGVRGDARTINAGRKAARVREVRALGWRGSEAVVDPDGVVEGTIGREGDKGRTNHDYFANRKAQGWWSIRRRFQLTHRWVVDGIKCKPDDIVSIDPRCPNHMRLVAELSQPTYATNGVGKVVINKQPNGMPSPNLADAAMMRFAPKDPRPVEFTREMISQIRQYGRRRRMP